MTEPVQVTLIEALRQHQWIAESGDAGHCQCWRVIGRAERYPLHLADVLLALSSVSITPISMPVDQPPPDEVWVPLPGWPIYEVSSLGRIRSIDRISFEKGGRTCRRRGYIRKLYTNPVNGYLVVSIGNNGKWSTRAVHVLVALAFHGPKPSANSVVRHLNGDKYDNRPENLAWGTMSDNNFDLVVHGTHFNTKKTHCKYGHPFNEENTYWRPTGGRRCLTCKRAAARKKSA